MHNYKEFDRPVKSISPRVQGFLSEYSGKSQGKNKARKEWNTDRPGWLKRQRRFLGEKGGASILAAEKKDGKQNTST
ncbi:MAG TPA: hypothetical protein VM123_19325 [archaeon]|nr:hypothetical protein [archaeon]